MVFPSDCLQRCLHCSELQVFLCQYSHTCGGGHLPFAFELSWCDNVGFGLTGSKDPLMHFPERRPFSKTICKHALVTTTAYSLSTKAGLLEFCLQAENVHALSFWIPKLIAYSFCIPRSWHHWPSFKPRWPELTVSSELSCHFCACQRTKSGFPC